MRPWFKCVQSIWNTTVSSAADNSLPRRTIRNLHEISDYFYWHGINFIPAWISNHMSSKMLDKIIYPFSNCNGCSVGISEWISNFIQHNGCHFLSMLGLKLNHVSKMGPRVVRRLIAWGIRTQGLYWLSGKTSYRQISWSLEAARLSVIMNVFAALLPRSLSNFRAIEKV